MSKPQYNYQPLHALPIRHQLKFIVFTALVLVSLLGLLASISVTLIFAPKPELGRWMPEGIRCATCGEISDRGVRERVGCRAIEGEVSFVSFIIGKGEMVGARGCEDLGI